MKTTTSKQSLTENLEQLLIDAPCRDSFFFALWMSWCESVTINSQEFQQVLANKSVNNWFLVELEKEEREYFTLVKRYSNVNSADTAKLYVKCVFNLFSKFPKSLLQEAKARQEKSRSMMIAGNLVEISIVNLN